MDNILMGLLGQIQNDGFLDTGIGKQGYGCVKPGITDLKIRTEIGRHFFTQRVNNLWNTLSKRAV